MMTLGTLKPAPSVHVVRGETTSIGTPASHGSMETQVMFILFQLDSCNIFQGAKSMEAPLYRCLFRVYLVQNDS